MRVDAFAYDLPPERIAQHPTTDREAARLMRLLPDGTVEHRTVGELASLVPEGALVVVNDTRVIPARLLGQKADTGGRVEIFLVRKLGDRPVTVGPFTREVEVWRALGKASKALRFGTDVVIVGGTWDPLESTCRHASLSIL